MSKITVSLVGGKKAVFALSRLSVLKRQDVKRAVNEAALQIQRLAKNRVTVDTGGLRSSIGMTAFADGMTHEIGTNVVYAPYVEFGTKPHTEFIYPRFKKALRFKIGRVWIFAKRVRNVPHAARPFLYPAWEIGKAWLLADLKRVFNRGAR